jgi:tetratricopeptide (TPR) repeat protein
LAAAYLRKGNSLVMLGRHAEARDHYLKAMELRPGYPEAERALAAVRELLGDQENETGEDAGGRQL